MRNNIVLVVVIAVVFGIGGIAVATGKPPRPSLDLTSAPDAAPVGLSPTTTQPPSPVAAAPASHGTAAVRIGARQVIVTYDSGLVTGLSYGAITITHPDGSNATLSINASTRYRPAGVHPKVGERALVYSTGGTARIIASRG